MFGLKEKLRRCRSEARLLLAANAEKGPYRFLVKDWNRINDINLVADVLETGCPRVAVNPLELPIENFGRYLVIAPHPDDESIGAGGTLLLARNLGAKIDVIFATDGEQRNMAGGRGRSIEVRKAEAESVIRHLAATSHYLGISNISAEVKPRHVFDLARLIQKVEPDVLLIPWLFDYPAKHRLINHLLWLACAHETTPDFEVWGYQVHNNFHPNGVVDITPVVNEKCSLIKYYESQNGPPGPSYTDLTRFVNGWNSRFISASKFGKAPRFAEIFLALPKKEWMTMVERHYFRRLDATYCEKRFIAERVRRLHQEMSPSRIRRLRERTGASVRRVTEVSRNA